MRRDGRFRQRRSALGQRRRCAIHRKHAMLKSLPGGRIELAGMDMKLASYHEARQPIQLVHYLSKLRNELRWFIGKTLLWASDGQRAMNLPISIPNRKSQTDLLWRRIAMGDGVAVFF